MPEYGYDQLDYSMTIEIERTPKGRLWACWVGGSMQTIRTLSLPFQAPREREGPCRLHITLADTLDCWKEPLAVMWRFTKNINK